MPDSPPSVPVWLSSLPLRGAILFADEPAAVILAASQARTHADDGGVGCLIGESTGIANIIDIEAVEWEGDAGEGDREEEQTNKNENDEAKQPTKVTQPPKQSVSVAATAAAAGASNESGWNNDLDFLDSNNEEETAEAEEAKHIPSDQHENKSTRPSNSIITSDGAEKSLPSPSRATLPFLPLDFSHSHVNDADVLALTGIEETQYEHTNKTNTSVGAAGSKKAPKAKAKPKDEWDWNDDEDEEPPSEEEEEEEDVQGDAPPSVRVPPSQSPSTPPPAPTTACFVLSAMPSPLVLTRVASIIGRGRGAARTGGDETRWTKVFVLIKGNSAHSFLHDASSAAASLAVRLTELARQHDPTFACDIEVRFVPFGYAEVDSDRIDERVLLIPLARSNGEPNSLATYPPALHAADTHTFPTARANKPSTGTTANPPSHSSDSSASSTSSPNNPSSSFFSISSLAKGLSDHIREAEEIAMAGVDPASSTGRGASHSSESDSLTSQLVCSLANTLFELRMQPDVFTVGHRTKEIGQRIVQQLTEMKKEEATNTGAIAAAATAAATTSDAYNSTRQGRSSSLANSAAPPAAAPAPWSSASLILIDRSLDLLSVAKHHPPSEVRDRITDFDGVAEDCSPSHSTPPLSVADLTQQLLANWSSDVAAADRSTATITAAPTVPTDVLRAQLFSDAPDSSRHRAVQLHRSCFPSSLPSELRVLFDSIRTVGDGAPLKAVLTTILSQVRSKAEECGLDVTNVASAGSSATQLTASIHTLLDLFTGDGILASQQRPFIRAVRLLLRSFLPTAGAASSKSLYDRLIAFEQLLTMQYIASRTSLGGGSHTDANDEEQSRSIKGMVAMVVEFVDGMADEKEQLSLKELIRLCIFLSSLIAGQHLLTESEVRPLKSMVRSYMDDASSHAWLRVACGVTTDLSPPFLDGVCSRLFSGLASVSLARSDLTAADLIDLTAPLEGVDDAKPQLAPFATRLIRRIQQPENLLDDLEHIPFAHDGTNEKDSDATDGTIASNPSSSGAVDSVASSGSSVGPSVSGSSGWSFFGSLASVVSSVANSTPLRGFGFSSVVRPEERAKLIIACIGGVTHAEVRQIHNVVREWRQREIQREKSNGGNGTSAAQREVTIVATHIATADEIVRQMIRNAANEVTTESQ